MKKATIVVTAAVCAVMSASALADEANVRVIHASPDAPAVDVFVNGGLGFSNLGFTNVSNYVGLPMGNYNVQVTPFGDPDTVVIDANLSLTGGVDYSVVAINTLANIEPLVLVDDNTIDPESARVRFVHASPDAPAVDIALAGGSVLFGNVSFSEVGNYLNVAGGSYDLEVRIAGESTVVLDLPGIEVMNGAVYTVFAMGFAAGEPGLQAVISVDNMMPSPAALPLLAMGGLLVRSRRRTAA
jgi:MYXO-CTERM domain-containing protein